MWLLGLRFEYFQVIFFVAKTFNSYFHQYTSVLNLTTEPVNSIISYLLHKNIGQLSFIVNILVSCNFEYMLWKSMFSSDHIGFYAYMTAYLKYVLFAGACVGRM